MSEDDKYCGKTNTEKQSKKCWVVRRAISNGDNKAALRKR